jgi:fatty-acyl-CoA synthase
MIINPNHDTISSRLQRSASTNDNGKGIIFVDRKENEIKWSWAQIWERACRSASHLRSQGVKNGDSVGIILPTGIEFMDSYFGCQIIGAIPIPLYPPVRLGRLDEYISKTVAMFEAANIQFLISNKRTGRILGQVVVKLPNLVGHFKAQDLIQTSPIDTFNFNTDQLAMAQFSSGTTVKPKPVGLTHKQILSNVDAILHHIPLDDGIEQKGCSWLPLYHDMGLIGCIFPALSAGADLVLISPENFLAKPAVWLRSISKHKCTVSPAPNFAYALCLERIKDSDLSGCDLSSWWFALNGAEPIASHILRDFSARFGQWGFPATALTPVYGLAEAALAVTFSDPKKSYSSLLFDRQKLSLGEAVSCQSDAHAVEMASVGKALNGFEIEIRNEKGMAVPQGTVGNIFAKGPSIMWGYLDGTENPVENGWLKTGDKGFLFKDELFISGREKDVIILNGANHSPHDIEQALDQITGVRTGCVAAVSDITQDGEHLIVFVEFRTIEPDLAKKCSEAILAATGLRASAIILLDSGTLARTSSGKIRRHETLRQWKEGILSPPDTVSPYFLTSALIKSAWGYIKTKRSQ